MRDFVTEELINKIKSTKPSIIPTDQDFAYLAGLIEAEGTFRIKSWKPPDKPNKVYHTSLEIGNTRYPIFPWLMDRFGGNISFVHIKRNKRAVAIWSLQSKSLLIILNRILCFFSGLEKKQVCELAYRIQQNYYPLMEEIDIPMRLKERMEAVISKREFDLSKKFIS